MKKFKLPILLLAICLLVCLVCVMAACNGETATDGTQDNTNTSPSTPEEEKPQPTVEELSKAECESILQAKTQNLLSSVEVANKHEIEFLKSADFSADFTVTAVEMTKVNLNGGEVYGCCTLTAHSDGAVHSVYFVLKTNLFSFDRTSYEVLKEELAYLTAYYVSVYENSADIPATDGFFDFNSLVAGETVPSPLTEEDYKEQCTEIINVKTLMVMNELHPNTLSEINNKLIKLINNKTGEIYCNAEFFVFEKNYNRFYILQTNINELNSTSYEKLNNDLFNLKVESMEEQTMIEPEVSAEAYANLVNFVIKNSIGWGPAGTYVEILNVSTIEFVGTSGGNKGNSGCTMYVLKEAKVYEIKLRGASYGRQEECIYQLCEDNDLQSGWTTVEIFSTDDYLSFDSIGSAG